MTFILQVTALRHQNRVVEGRSGKYNDVLHNSEAQAVL